MLGFVRGLGANLGTVGEILRFLWARKLWWLTAMVVVLLLFGLLVVFAAASGVGPFIYALF